MLGDRCWMLDDKKESARQSGSKAAVNGEKWMVDGSEREQERELAIPCLLSLITHHSSPPSPFPVRTHLLPSDLCALVPLC